jgi:hypothetical protein
MCLFTWIRKPLSRIEDIPHSGLEIRTITHEELNVDGLYLGYIKEGGTEFKARVLTAQVAISRDRLVQTMNFLYFFEVLTTYAAL